MPLRRGRPHHQPWPLRRIPIPRNLFADILRLIAELRPAAGSRIDVKRLLVLGPIKNQRERCVWMTTKSTFSALGAPMPRLGCTKAPRRGTGVANVRRKRRSRPQHKVIAPLPETVEVQSRVWVSLRIARPTQTGQFERGLLSNLRVIWEMPVKGVVSWIRKEFPQCPVQSCSG